MMFLLRSAFWLTAAFLVIRPGVDLRATANDVTSQAMARGSQFVSDQINAIECDSLQCFGGKAVLSAALPPIPPSDPTPMHARSKDIPVPLPRPRPDDAG